MALSLGALSVTLEAAFDRFNKSAEEARRGLSGVASDMRDMVNNAGKVAIAAAAAGAAIVGAFVKAGLDSVAAQAKLAHSMNATVDGLRAVTEAGEDLGFEAEEMSAGLAVFNARLGEAQRAGSPAAKMLEQLGLKAAELARLDVDQRLAAVADRVRALGLSSSQAADLARQFGLRGAEWGVMFQQGGDAIRSAREEVDTLGRSISEIDAEQVKAAHKAMKDMGDVLENIRNQIAIALAPIVQELAERFNKAAESAGGFRDQARGSAEGAARAIAKVADVLQGLRVVFKGVELVARGFGAAVISIVQIAAEGIVSWVDLVIAAINKVINALNKLPKVEIANIDPWTDSRFMQGLRVMGEEARNSVGDTRSELHNLAMQDLPSAKVEAFFAAVHDRSKEAAAATAAARKEMQAVAGVAGFGVEDDGAAKKAAEDARKREQERMMAEAQARLDRVAALKQSLATEAELETEAFYAKMATLAELSEAELDQIGGYQARKEQLEAEHMERLKAIREAGMTEIEKFQAMSYARQVSTVAGSIANMTAGVASGNKKMFELNKVAALAQTAIDLPAAIIASYKNAGGWPLGAAAAAAMAAAGLAQIAQIKNAKFGGGGGGAAPAPTGGGGGGSGSGGAGQTIAISGLSPGSLFTGEAVRSLIERINDAVKDGATIVVEP